MKRFNFLLATLLAIIFSNGAKAAKVDNYKVDFNTTISTSAHDFKVATGWGHVVDYYENSYVSYTYSSTSGIDRSGALKCGDQLGVGMDWYTGDAGKDTYDLLVTPQITGTSSIWVKKSSSSGAVKFYKVTKSGTTYIKGVEISVTTDVDLTTSSFVKVSIPAVEGEYIGIYGSNVYLDDFEAASAEVELVKALKVTNQSAVGSTDVYCNAERKYTVTIKATIQNIGDLDINVGDENYSLSVIDKTTGNVLSTTPVNEALAVGGTAYVTVAAEVDYATYSGYNRAFQVRENITSTTYQRQTYFYPKDYVPKLYVRDGKSNTVSSNTKQDFGYVNGTATKSFTIKNTGAAPMEITAIEVPAGYSINLKSFPVNVASQESETLEVTFDASTPGAYSGDLTLKITSLDDFLLPLSGTMLDPKKYFLNFEDRKMPAGSLYENWSVTTNTNGDNNYAVSGRTDAYKLITPKLKVSDGEIMTFEVAKRSTSSKMTVYYSPDRENWTEALAIPNSELPSSTGTFKQFTLPGVPAGEYYIAFESGYCYLDNVYGFELVEVAHDAMVTAQKLPVKGMVNYEYKASATLKNIHKDAETAESYTATLYVNSEAVATATSEDIAAAGSADFDFAYTPHVAGTSEAYIEFAFGSEYKVQSEKVNVTISEEKGDKVATVGTKSDTGFHLLHGGFKLNEAETIYTVEKLGFTDNKRLTGVLFKGTKTSDDQVKHIKVYLQNTEDATPTMTKGVELPVSEMTLVYDGDYTLKKGETDLLDLTFTTPFTYQKDMNLRMVIQGSSDNKIWQTNYEVEKADQTHFKYRNHDTDLSGVNPSSTYLPVANFTIEVLPATVSGIVTTVDGTSPLADAEVTLTSDNVIYRATTDAEGKYQATVYQVEKTYSATMKKDAVEKTKTDITFAPDQTTEVNFILDGAVTFKKGQASTLILATAPDAAKGDYYALSAVSGNQVVFTKVETPQANTPYVFMAKDDYTTETISVPTTEAGATTIDDVTFQGIYDYKNLVSDETTTYYGFRASDGTFVKVGKTKGAVIYPMHAYIKVSGSESSKELRFFFEDNEATTIVGTLVDAEDKAELYDLNGRRVSKNQAKGVVVKNGKKLNVKNLKK